VTEAYPAYLALPRGELHRRALAAREALRSCCLCPRACRVDRLADERGYCGIGRDAVVASCGPHFGEEQLLVGVHGSGTVFFSGCNLRCVYCQNHDISADPSGGSAVTPERLASLFLHLEAQHCHNLNLVSPSHVIAQILAALDLAVEQRFSLPLVWNCGGYESLDALRLLDGIVDIYMPDAKYQDPAVAERLSDAADYPDRLREGLREMHRQVGSLTTGEGEIARRGLLVRHLILPHDLAGTATLVRFLAEELSPHTYLNLMDQYRPCHRASAYAELSRRPSPEEIGAAFEHARAAGIYRLDRPS
jgi:putative pyruvate formate lyase activating enzyme